MRACPHASRPLAPLPPPPPPISRAAQFSGGSGNCSEATLLLLRLLQLKPEAIVCEDADRRTPLHWACVKNALPCVKALLGAGAKHSAVPGATPSPLASPSLSSPTPFLAGRLGGPYTAALGHTSRCDRIGGGAPQGGGGGRPLRSRQAHPAPLGGRPVLRGLCQDAASAGRLQRGRRRLGGLLRATVSDPPSPPDSTPSLLPPSLRTAHVPVHPPRLSPPSLQLRGAARRRRLRAGAARRRRRAPPRGDEG